MNYTCKTTQFNSTNAQYQTSLKIQNQYRFLSQNMPSAWRQEMLNAHAKLRDIC